VESVVAGASGDEVTSTGTAMRLHLLWAMLKWPAVLAALAGLLVLGYWVHGTMRADRKATQEADSVQVPRRAANSVVKLGARLAESFGLRDEPARETTWQPRLVVYGRVIPNPRATTEVRAPFAGTLRAVKGTSWPALGSRVKAGQVLGRLDIRVGPQERLDLLVKLGEARLKQTGSEDILKILQDRVDRLKTVSDVVSQTERDAARVRLAEGKIQLETAKAAVKQWQDALAAIDSASEHKDATWSQLLTAPAGGEITELLGRPDMTVEAGSVIARVVDFRHALVRVDVPVQALAGGPPAKLDLFTAPSSPPALEGISNRPEPAPPTPAVTATLVGAAPQVEPASQFAGYWYEVDTADPKFPGAAWRPGLFVKGSLPVAGANPQSAVAVPAAALLFHQGRALVYVTIGPGRFERREVRVLGRQGESWILASGVTAGEPVVCVHAQVLLSEEFRGEVDND
jgi:pyruvate/2-oxoglutarate dehydrogenase complex dihydrolipoamide acyltransferase (E2) component